MFYLLIRLLLVSDPQVVPARPDGTGFDAHTWVEPVYAVSILELPIHCIKYLHSIHFKRIQVAGRTGRNRFLLTFPILRICSTAL